VVYFVLIGCHVIKLDREITSYFGLAYLLPYNAFNGCNYSYQQADLVKLDILLNAQPVDAMATIVHNTKAYRVGRELTEKLKTVIDRSFSLINDCVFFMLLL